MNLIRCTGVTVQTYPPTRQMYPKIRLACCTAHQTYPQDMFGRAYVNCSLQSQKLSQYQNTKKIVHSFYLNKKVTKVYDHTITAGTIEKRS